MKKNLKYIIVCLCLILFLIFVYKVLTNKTIYVDDMVYTFISDNIITDRWTNFIKIITSIASPVGIVIEALLLVILVNNKKVKVLIATDLVGITVINNLLKIIIARPRPNVNSLVIETGYSFPSGHSVTSMVFYGYLVYLIWKYIDNKKIKIPLVIFFVLLIFIIGFSRIYLGVHYTSDVLSGFLLGIIYLMVFIKMSEKYI